MHQCYSVWHRQAKFDKFYMCTKISTLVQHKQCYCWWCFKAANALQSYLALRCVVHHPSANNSAASIHSLDRFPNLLACRRASGLRTLTIHSPALWRRAQHHYMPGSNVNLLQINIWLWTNHNAFFCISIVGTSCTFTDGRKLMKYSEVWPHFWIVERWIVGCRVLVIEKGWKKGGVRAA